MDSSLALYGQAKGPFAVPGMVGPVMISENNRAMGGYSGSAPAIVIGEKVRFSHLARGTYSSVAVLVHDRYDNSASFSTTVTLSLNGVSFDNTRTPSIGNIVQSSVTWGQGYLGQEQISSTTAQLAQVASNLALFPDFTVEFIYHKKKKCTFVHFRDEAYETAASVIWTNSIRKSLGCPDGLESSSFYGIIKQL